MYGLPGGCFQGPLGRPDLATEALPSRRQRFIIVGGADAEVIALNEMAFERLPGPKSLSIVPGAGHLFSEPGALEEAIDRAASWFECYLNGKR